MCLTTIDTDRGEDFKGVLISETFQMLLLVSLDV